MRPEFQTSTNGYRTQNGHAGTNGHAQRNGKGALPAVPREFKGLPQNLDCERDVIACAILEPEMRGDLIAILRSPEPFYKAEHQELWRVILEEFAAGVVISPETMNEALEHRGLLHLSDLLLEEILPKPIFPLSSPQHAHIIRSKSMFRGMMEAAEEIHRAGYSNERTAEDAIAQALQRLYGVIETHGMSRAVTVSSLLPEVWRQIEDRQAGRILGVRTGFYGLDGVTAGFQPQELVILAARPSVGKTALALNICEHLALHDHRPVVLISLEMSPGALSERLVVSVSRVNGLKVKTGTRLTADEHTRLVDAQRRIHAAAAVHVVEQPGQNIVQVCAEIRSHVNRYGAVLVIVDYAQLIGSDNPRDTEVAAVTKVSKAMKGVARELNVPVLLLSQLHRGVENREDHRPKLSDLRGSGSLEQDADLVLFLYRPEYYKPGAFIGEAELILAKNRNGPTGEFKLAFEKECMRFQDFIPEPLPGGAPY